MNNPATATPTHWRQINVDPQPTGFGATISAPPLAAGLEDHVVAEIRAAWLAHGVVALTNQPLDNSQLQAFSLRLGPFGIDPFIEATDSHAHVVAVHRRADEKATVFGGGWHSDWSFQAQPPAATLLHARIVPPVGGDTLYADATRAFEALPANEQDRLRSLRTINSARGPYGRDGFFAKDDSPRAMRIISSADAETLQVHPLVRRHPETGRESLFINPVYTVGIDGWADSDAHALLRDLFAHMHGNEFVYRHQWAKDMLVIWDNRCVNHSAQGGYDGHERLMFRTTVAGDTPAGRT